MKIAEIQPAGFKTYIFHKFNFAFHKPLISLNNSLDGQK